MQAVDAKLKAEGVDITSRPILAGREVGLQFGVPVPVAFADASRLPPDIRRYAPLSRAIQKWYSDAYGDRLKVNWSPGRTVVLLDDDLYVMGVPRLLGSARFVTQRAFIPHTAVTRGPAIFNTLQAVEGLTPAKASTLSDEALGAAAKAFSSALWASYALEATPHELIQIARGDIAAATNALIARGERFGQSKWASLQAGEKVLKAAIALAGGAFSQTHDLGKLGRELNAAGINLDATGLLRAMQCSPKIRYGEEPCSRNEALAAHHASLALVNALRDAGAKFAPGIAMKA